MQTDPKLNEELQDLEDEEIPHDQLEPPRKEDILSLTDDEEAPQALDREALVNLEIRSNRGNECQDMLLLLNFLGFSPR